MKKAFLAVAVLAAAALLAVSCRDDSGDSEKSEPTGQNENPDSGKEPPQSVATFTDSRDGTVYKKTTIDGKTWMAENLNDETEGSECYHGEAVNADKYGRLYKWAAAMGLPSSSNTIICDSLISKKHQGVCPAGWHVPTFEEWDELLIYVSDGVRYPVGSAYTHPVAGKHLKAKEGWKDCGPSGSGKEHSCEDTYGFAALPGLGSSESFAIGREGDWWSASEDSGLVCAEMMGCGQYLATYLTMYYYGNFVLYGTTLKEASRYIRCVED
jgi:uncharacterized protein (TIGR02145 family)